MPAWWRWLLVLPAAACGPALMVAAYLLLDAALTRLCPRELLVSGACTAGWYPAADLAATCTSVALGALATVVPGAIAAPARRTHVAIALMAAGTAWAAFTLFAIGPAALAPFACALVAGAAGVWLVRRRAVLD